MARRSTSNTLELGQAQTILPLTDAALASRSALCSGSDHPFLKHLHRGRGHRGRPVNIGVRIVRCLAVLRCLEVYGRQNGFVIIILEARVHTHNTRI